MADRSKLVTLKIRNLGCIGAEGLEVALDNIVCLVGRNNCGKSTVLRAYELAQGNIPLTEQDRCQWTPEGDFPEVELVVHVPDGIPNVAAKWKLSQDGMKLVRSRWVWSEPGTKPVRQTWDHELSEWAEEEKAGGLDEVFGSRLPQPLRIGSLQDPSNEHNELLKLVTEPVVRELKQLQDTPGSTLRVAMLAVVTAAMSPVTQFQNDIDIIGSNVGKGFKEVFPDLDLRIKISMDPPSFDAAKAVVAGSSIRFIEANSETVLKQQGTGSQRALFWALLRVRNTIVQERKAKDDRLKEATRLKKERDKEQKKTKRDETKIQELNGAIGALEGVMGGLVEDLALPGNILLIDEPENALHPMAVRAARDHLYALAQDPNWQVMRSTHSPYFINPLEDHTTILRIERDGKKTSARTFRTTTAKFSDVDRANLRALLQLDAALSEMFFGSYPIIVEGDTESAAFIASVVQDKDPLATQVTLIPSRGKALIAPLIRLLTHFDIPFGVLHDMDTPLRRDGKKNGAWTENLTIINALIEARAAGIEVRHRVSVPDFERRLGASEESKDKPIRAYQLISGDPKLRGEVRRLFVDLHHSVQHQPLDHLPQDSDTEGVAEALKTLVQEWAAKNEPDDQRFRFSE